MGQWVGAQGQVKVAKISQTCPHCDVTSRKRQSENKKRFFFDSTRRLAASVEGLNSSLAQLPGELWSCKNLKSRVTKVARAGFEVFITFFVFSNSFETLCTYGESAHIICTVQL